MEEQKSNKNNNQLQQQEQNQEIICQKQEHDNQQIIYFKFTENEEEMLQCPQCNLNDIGSREMLKKICIHQLKEKPAYQISNFPPLRTKQRSEQVKQSLKNNKRQQMLEFQKETQNIIDENFVETEELLINVIRKQHKDVKILFDQWFKFLDITKNFEIEPLRELIEKYKKKEITFDQFFEAQLEMKKQLQNEQSIEIILSQNIIQQEIRNSLQNLKDILNQKVENFKEENFKEEIIISNKGLDRIQELTLQAKIDLQDENQNDGYYERQLLALQSPKFFKPKLRDKCKKEISISNDNKIIDINDGVLGSQKYIYSGGLDLKKSHHFKLKIDFNFHQQQNPSLTTNQQQQKKQQQTIEQAREIMKKQVLVFTLLSENQKDSLWGGTNRIVLTNGGGECFGYNANKQQFAHQGIEFCSFWNAEETIVNVRFNVEQQQFQVYDDQKKFLIRINNNDFSKIQDDQVRLGILIDQRVKSKIRLNMLSYQRE